MQTANEIIEEKVKEWENKMECIPECKNGLYEDIGCPRHGIDSITTRKFLRSAILEAMKQAVEEVTPVKTQGESVMLEHGSEYTTPRMYRAFGFNAALSDLEEKRKQFFKDL